MPLYRLVIFYNQRRHNCRFATAQCCGEAERLRTTGHSTDTFFKFQSSGPTRTYWQQLTNPPIPNAVAAGEFDKLLTAGSSINYNREQNTGGSLNWVKLNQTDCPNYFFITELSWIYATNHTKKWSKVQQQIVIDWNCASGGDYLSVISTYILNFNKWWQFHHYSLLILPSL